MKAKTFTFSGTVHNIESNMPGILNPNVLVPEDIVDSLHALAGKEKGPVQVKCGLKKKWYKANIVKYKGAWRLYLHGIMRNETGIEVGDTVRVTLVYDPEARMPPMPKAFKDALAANKPAKKIWLMQSKSRRKEVLNYLNSLKTQESVARNVQKLIVQFLEKRKQ
ncbi:MAG TPA: YdeI/OmpD-associated family protein [Chitinophagaceae bacterium]|nr:YdeI/OmpD-associated family protein [Chitinophagaceae bacterium]